jgi:hypothetical protein
MSKAFRDAFQRISKNVPNMPSGGSGGGGNMGDAAGRAITSAVVAVGLGYGALNSFYNVQGGHRAVVFNRITGMKEKVYGEGLNFNIPWFERPVIYDIRTRPVNLQTLTGSKDLQMVTIAIRVLHKPNPNELVWIYRYLGKNYDERVLPSIMNECAKAVVARYNANELLTKRDKVSADIAAELKMRASGFKVMLDDVAITHLSFSPEYAKAVEAKQVGALLFSTMCDCYGCIRLFILLVIDGFGCGFERLFFLIFGHTCCLFYINFSHVYPSSSLRLQPNKTPNAPSTWSLERSKKRRRLLPRLVEKPSRRNSLVPPSRRIQVS